MSQFKGNFDMFFTYFGTNLSKLVATGVYVLFKICQKNSLHDCVKTRGEGGQGPFTQCVKKNIRIGRGWLPLASCVY